MIKEYIVICKCCGNVVSEEGLDHLKQYGYTDRQICTCDPSKVKYRVLVTISFNHYGSLWKYFKKAIEIAQDDFEDLNTDSIEIVHFGGERSARTFGIRFNIENIDSIKLDYERRLFSEPLL